MTSIKVTRVFKLGATELPDPNPLMSENDVLDHYSDVYPQLNNASVKDNGIVGEQHVFAIHTSTGHNG